jgi:hypothetical protein
VLRFGNELQVLVSNTGTSIFAAIKDDHITISHLPQSLHGSVEVIYIQSICLRLVLDGVQDKLWSDCAVFVQDELVALTLAIESKREERIRVLKCMFWSWVALIFVLRLLLQTGSDSEFELE